MLGNGDLSAKLDVTAQKFSGFVKEKIEAAGGSVTAEAFHRRAASTPVEADET